MNGSTALLLIDVQNDFLARPGLHPPAPQLTASIADLLDLGRQAGWTIVHVRTEAASDGSNWMPHWHRAGRADCLAGSEGAASPEEIRQLPGEAVVTKSHFSAFDNDTLEPLLRDARVERLVVAGVHTHACIRASVTDAYARGFEVVIAEDAVGSYDPEHASLSLEWLDGRAASVKSTRSLAGSPAIATRPPLWLHRNPVDWDEVLDEVVLTDRTHVSGAAAALSEAHPGWEAVPIIERAERLRAWRHALQEQRERWIDLLVHDVGKPRVDAEGEFGYALALLDHVCGSLVDEEVGEGREVRYRALGVAALVTPWNNPFAIPISKLAPALGYGNCALWKPALPASNLSRQLMASMADAGLSEAVALVTGDASSGRAVIETPDVALVSFTGSIAAGRQIGRACGRLMRPLQAELGGNNAAIILAGVDLEAVSADLAAAMFSFAGQRCTAIRRLIVERSIADAFAEALKAAVEALPFGMPADPATRVGPVIAMDVRERLRSAAEAACAAGARMLTGEAMCEDLPERGCWMAPTVVTDLPEGAQLVREELFGPVVALQTAGNFDEALTRHNGVEQGLLGTLYSADPAQQARFLREAEAGLLSINRARPPFAAAGPFLGWKASGFGAPEHGRWNRDVYTRVQAVYRHAAP